MQVPFQLSNHFEQDVHHYVVYESVDLADTSWLAHLADEYVKMLAHRETPLTSLKLPDADMQLDVSNVQKYIRKASIPRYKKGNFNVVRSDFGELLCYLLLEEHHHTRFGAKSISSRELRDSPGRGIDAIGVELAEDHIDLVLCEVKVSDEQPSPPRVVDHNEDCLSKQQRYHLAHLDDATKDKVWRVANKTRDPEVADLLTVAALYLEAKRLDKLRIILCNVLIRPKAKYTQADFGSFYSRPELYDPAAIRFLVACIPDNVDAVITQWYDVIQKTEVAVE